MYKHGVEAAADDLKIVFWIAWLENLENGK